MDRSPPPSVTPWTQMEPFPPKRGRPLPEPGQRGSTREIAPTRRHDSKGERRQGLRNHPLMSIWDPGYGTQTHNPARKSRRHPHLADTHRPERHTSRPRCADTHQQEQDEGSVSWTPKDSVSRLADTQRPEGFADTHCPERFAHLADTHVSRVAQTPIPFRYWPRVPTWPGVP
jgi:hypothetical protein